MRVFSLLLSLSVLPAIPQIVVGAAQGAPAHKSSVTVLRGAPFGMTATKIKKPRNKHGFQRDIQNPGILRSAKQVKRLRKLKFKIIRGTPMSWFALQQKSFQEPENVSPVLLDVKHSNELIIKYTLTGTRYIVRGFQRYTGFKRQYSGPRYTGFRNDYFGPRYLEGSY